DSLSRVTGYNGAWGTGSYTYDSVGNRKSKTIASVTTSHTYSTSSNRLDSTSGGEATTYSYNLE
ncbi:MAG: RHS repeat protein, partial [Nitrospirota bacterium]